jgi:hypothetical protein
MSRMGKEVTAGTEEAAAEAREEIPTSRKAYQPCNIVFISLSLHGRLMNIFRGFGDFHSFRSFVT